MTDYEDHHLNGANLGNMNTVYDFMLPSLFSKHLKMQKKSTSLSEIW